MHKKQRMTALDGSKRKGYEARARGVPSKKNPHRWEGHLYDYNKGPRTWGTLHWEAWLEGWYECAEGKPLTSFLGHGIPKEILDKYGNE